MCKTMELRKIALETDATDTPLRVLADRIVLRQIILNLLSYAADLTIDQCIRVRLAAEDQAVRAVVETTVDRTAPEPDAATSQKLAIAQQLVLSQQGTLNVQLEQSEWSADVSLSKLQLLPILVIDDNAAAIKLFARYLTNSPYLVVGAQTGREAVELVKQLRPAAITLDVMMPNQDGWEVLQTLRNVAELSMTPIIVCSVLNEPELAFSLGASDFLRKPVTQAGLVAMLERWTKLR
jgi:CheY-like chemotaxis protein